MRKRSLWTMALFVLVGPLSADNVAYVKRQVLGVWTHLIIADLNDPNVKVSVHLADPFPGGAQPFQRMVRDSGAIAAVTGAFFSTTSLYPVGDIVVDGQLRYFGGMGAALAITSENQPTIIDAPYGRRLDWSWYETVLAGGISLVEDGQIALCARCQGFSDPGLFRRARRVAVGITDHGKVILMATNELLTLSETAKVMQRLGCVHAMNLDGGTSAAMAFRDHVPVRPGRRLVNILTIHTGVPREARYHPPSPEEILRRRTAEEAHAQYVNGERLMARGEYRRARRKFRVAVMLAPDNASYWRHLAAVDDRLDKPQAAAEALRRAAAVYLEKQMPQEAIRCLEDSLQRSADSLEAREQLVHAHRVAGHHLAAARHAAALAWMRLHADNPTITTPMEASAPTSGASRAELRSPRQGLQQRPVGRIARAARSLRDGCTKVWRWVSGRA